MKISELRQGNIINNNNVVYEILHEYVNCSGSSFSGSVSYFENELKPIVLTPEIIKEYYFDFVKEAGGYAGKYHILYEEPYGQKNCWLLAPFCTNDKDCYILLKYLHELQNICWALSGCKKELEKK